MFSTSQILCVKLLNFNKQQKKSFILMHKLTVKKKKKGSGSKGRERNMLIVEIFLLVTTVLEV